MKYYEADRGRFDASLVREGLYGKPAEEVAYTDGDCVKVTEFFVYDVDRKAVMEFASSYDLPLDIMFWA